MDIRGDVILMFALAAATIVYFTTFDAPLRRTIAYGESEMEETAGLSLAMAITKVNDNLIAEGGKESGVTNSETII